MFILNRTRELVLGNYKKTVLYGNVTFFHKYFYDNINRIVTHVFYILLQM